MINSPWIRGARYLQLVIEPLVLCTSDIIYSNFRIETNKNIVAWMKTIISSVAINYTFNVSNIDSYNCFTVSVVY